MTHPRRDSLAVLVVSAGLLAGCGGQKVASAGGTTTAAAGTQEQRALMNGRAATASRAQSASSSTSSAPSAFKTPSGNIGCQYWPADSSIGLPASLRCDIRSGLRPQPSAACDLDWVGVELTAKGRGHAMCAGDTAFAPTMRALAYGTSWRAPTGITCTSRTDGLTCRNSLGHGFFLSRERWRVF